jgi:hypothetical protein
MEFLFGIELSPLVSTVVQKSVIRRSFFGNGLSLRMSSACPPVADKQMEFMTPLVQDLLVIVAEDMRTNSHCQVFSAQICLL